MQASFSSAPQGDGAVQAIGRIRTCGLWRGAEEPATDADRRNLLFLLVREAQDSGADAVVDVRFEAEETAESVGVSLRRLVATGSVLRLSLAA